MVRRWTAPRDGTVTLRSQVLHNVPAGDGIRAILVHSRKGANGQLLKNEVVHNSQLDCNLEGLNVSAGDTLDFVVNINGNLNNDQFLWSAEIQMQEKSWQAERDFAGKEPNYLTPWEQLAQVLLLSNEMVFVD